MKKLFLLCFVLFNLLFISDCISQTVQGNVTDPFTKKGIPNITVTIGKVSATTDSLGHYKIDEITSVGSDSQSKDIVIPQEYSLSQNFPNPFNATTIINFSLKKPEFVIIKIYDIIGNELTTLLKENKPAGKYSIVFNAVNLSSGVYFYSINTSGYSAIRKMVLLK